ncbi:MAG: MBL fold metallo-hydrolase [Bacteroidota bacterium]|nr:MBL fold metallo-hydrolase [Bacteroidota bacterium]
MSIKYQILGKPGRDNALMVWINGGNQIYRLLFDCGENLLHEVRQADVKSIDYLFFSHLHIDHVAGFDYFFRRNYDRETKPIKVWGPMDTSAIIHHKLQGFKWNLASGQPGIWDITDITDGKLIKTTYKTSDGFSKRHDESKEDFDGTILETKDFIVKVKILNHIIPTIGYRITEKNSLNIDKQSLLETGLPAGPWIEKLKDLSISGKESIEIEDKIYNIDKLRDTLLVETPGESIAYLTDFIYDKASNKGAIELENESETVVCESQYLSDDKDLAEKNYHLTAHQAAEIAKKAKAKKLILFHISERYAPDKDYGRILSEARSIFAETYFPNEWNKIHLNNKL